MDFLAFIYFILGTFATLYYQMLVKTISIFNFR